MRTCSVEGCERKHAARGFCDLHWQRWRKECESTEVGSLGTGRKDYEPGILYKRERMLWPEHILANRKGIVSTFKLEAWQDIGMPLDFDKWDYVSSWQRCYYRKKYEPGKVRINKSMRVGHIYWPENPLAVKETGCVSLRKLMAWQSASYPMPIGSLVVNSGKGVIRNVFEPGNLYVNKKDGRCSLRWPSHPLSSSQGGEVLLYRLAFWQYNNYDLTLLEKLQNGWSVHHGARGTEDISKENLMIRPPANHKRGLSMRDMVLALEWNGATGLENVQFPLWMEM